MVEFSAPLSIGWAMASHDTLFTNDSGAAGGSVAFIADTLPDVSLPPSNNTGLTNTSATNPLSLQFGNPDTPQFGAKTLYIKSVTLIEDRSKWISNKPTYLINWTENWPSIVGYAFGNFSVNSKASQPFLTFKTIGDGIGVNGLIRRVAWLSENTTTAASTAQNATDGVAGTTTTFVVTASDSDVNQQSKYSAYVHAATNETHDLHDIRLTALQANTMNIVGAIIYFENTGYNIDMLPGSTYVNKAKVVTAGITTMALPSYGSSLGGKALIYKTSSAGYAVSAISATSIMTLGSGTSGQALLSVSAGTGASFLAGYGLVATSGTSAYVGTVVSISTDTLTMAPNLSFTIPASSPVYRSWYASASASINASLMQMSNQIDFSKRDLLPLGATSILFPNSLPRFGATYPLLDPNGKYAMWGQMFGFTNIDSIPAVAFASGGLGFLQVDGLFGAAEVEFIGNGILHATFSVNGIPAHSVNAGQTGALRRTIFAEGGPGWNSFVIQPGVSLGILGISRINLYQRRSNIGISFGQLAEFETQQAYVDRGTINATMISLGVHRRIYSDQMALAGPFVRGSTAASVAGCFYYGTTTTCVSTTSYYGKNFSIIGTAGGGTLALDGAGIGLTFNIMQSVATEGFHSVVYTSGASATSIIQAFDYVRSQGELKDLQTLGPIIPVVPPVVTPIRSEIALDTANGFGSSSTVIRRFTNVRKSSGADLFYNDSPTLGGSVTVLTDGVYSMTHREIESAAAPEFSIMVNNTVPTTNPSSQTYTYAQGVRAQACAYSGGGTNSCAVTCFLLAGDVITFAASATNLSENALTAASVIRIN